MEKPHFLLHTSLLLLFTLCPVAAQTDITTDQSALLVLKSHITSDPHNILTTNWSTSNSNICNWIGVTCDVRHLRVRALNLSYTDFTGTIPPDIGNLTFLVSLRFMNNSFHGTLPQELSYLRRLKVLSFAYNNFTGTIPPWFGSLPKLQGFSLLGNQFSGLVPSAIFNLSTLETLDLRRNQLTGSIPREIGNLTMLKRLFLDFNNFEGIPKEIGSLDRLEDLYVQANALKGPIPMSVFNMSSLNTLALHGNSLNGSLPDNMCEHLPSLQSLVLAVNQLSGPLPSKLFQCRQLLEFGFSKNNLSGSIPQSIANMTQLTEIYLDYNNFTGSIPHGIGGLQNLRVLQLGVNNLNGSIPSTIFNISTIEVISLSSNQLSGNLPASIGLGVPNLIVLVLGLNKLGGSIPNFTFNASKLRTLDMGLNSFYGFVPSTLCSLTNLEFLSLTRNNLTLDKSTPEASILSCLANLPNLTRLLLAGNPLDATLPVSFGEFSPSLQHINLRNCNLRGSIPSSIGNLSSLIALFLGINQLNGSIPTAIGRLNNLQVLYLHENQLEGYVPDELCQLVNLGDLRLDRNQLSGPIPSCLGDQIPALRSMSLGSNLLTSTIPSTLFGLQDILSLDLSFNLLNGSISEDIGKLKAIRGLNLSDNRFSGSIPSNIGGLENLLNLSLANNNFQGPIPNSFGKLLSLEILDLSENSLSGEIPQSFEALVHLKYLNLSFNSLEGEIPTGGPFGNFSAQSFVSNAGLCGAARFNAARFNVSPCSKSRPNANSSKARYIIPGVISAVIFLVAGVSVLILRRKKKVKATTEATSSPQIPWRRVSRLELLRATNGFDKTNLLGSGGFGSVFKGTLSDGTDVAVKVFNLELEGAFKSFDRECEAITNIRHRNLIKIISCVSELDFKALVLQYMSNGSLEKQLYSPNCSLNILERLSIMIDVASALEYLHHGYSIPVVHCDMKPSNILLDEDMVGHVADFGIAKLLGGGDSMSQTRTLATIGYMAPEYGSEGFVSTRGDVYSFGIVLMETFTAKKPTDEKFTEEMSLKQWIANSMLRPEDTTVAEAVDANLLGTQEDDDDYESKAECLSSIMQLALACSAEAPEERINMKDALVTLKKIKIKYLNDTARVEQS